MSQPKITAVLLIDLPESTDMHIHAWEVPGDVGMTVDRWLTQIVGKAAAADIPKSTAQASFALFGQHVRPSE